MAVETSFAKEVTRPEEADDCLLAALRNNRDFDLTLLDVKNRVRNVTLGKKNIFGSKALLLLFFTGRPPLPARNHASQTNGSNTKIKYL